MKQVQKKQAQKQSMQSSKKSEPDKAYELVYYTKPKTEFVDDVVTLLMRKNQQERRDLRTAKERETKFLKLGVINFLMFCVMILLFFVVREGLGQVMSGLTEQNKLLMIAITILIFLFIALFGAAQYLMDMFRSFISVSKIMKENKIWFEKKYHKNYNFEKRSNNTIINNQ
jgi:hypothetical protein